MQSQISEGGFGIVYLVMDVNTYANYALKKLVVQVSESNFRTRKARTALKMRSEFGKRWDSIRISASSLMGLITKLQTERATT